MSANLYCWEPSLNLDPDSKDFDRRIDELLTPPHPEPSARMSEFVEALLARFPDDSESEQEDSVWADGFLSDDIMGQFINIGICWSSRVEEVFKFTITTANAMGLNCYDPQGEQYFPAPS